MTRNKRVPIKIFGCFMLFYFHYLTFSLCIYFYFFFVFFLLLSCSNVPVPYLRGVAQRGGGLAQWRATNTCHEPLNLLFCSTFQRATPAIAPNRSLHAVAAFPRNCPTKPFFPVESEWTCRSVRQPQASEWRQPLACCAVCNAL